MRHPLWENPEVIGIGREPMGAHFHIYGNSQDAHNQTGEQTAPLEGQWTFNALCITRKCATELAQHSAEWRGGPSDLTHTLDHG